MKRSLLLTAILLSAVGESAHAQSSVTLFGIVDSGLEYQTKTAGNSGPGVTALDGGAGPTLWGITGAEDIGGGTKIIFKLESGFSTINGGIGNSNGNFWGRTADVGAEGAWGSVNAGLQLSPFFLSIAGSDPRNVPFFASAMNPYVAAFGLNGAFEANSIIYSSPTVAGLRGSFEYAFGNVAGSIPTGSHISGSLNYDNGPFSATVAYFLEKAATSDVNTFQGENLGVGYKVGPVTAKLEFTKYRNLATDAALTNINVYSAGAEWVVTDALRLNAAVYASRDRNVTANKSLLYGAGAQYALSRRTVLYAQLGLVNNEGAMNTSLAVNAPSTFSAPQGTTFGTNIGIRHQF